MSGRRGEAGYSLVALVAAITVMLIAMGAAVPTWRYVVQNDREEELLFRGNQIARAIKRYQNKNGNALPTSLEALVKGKFLRKAWGDPMTKSGHWVYLPQGAGITPPPPRSGGPTTTTLARKPQPPTAVIGPFLGVASSSTEKSFRIVNGRQRYDEWLFVSSDKDIVPDSQQTHAPPPQPGGTPIPGTSPDEQ